MKNLLEILAENNIQIRPSYSGRSVGHCPFHDGDNTPSFTVYPGDTYYCFGCGAWGDPVKFLVDYKGMTPQEATEYVGVEIYKEKGSGVIKVKNVSETWKFLWYVAEKYHLYLVRNRGAMEYLYRRGLTLQTIRDFKIGYTDGFVLEIDNVHDAALGVEIGLIKRDGVESMSHRITIPNLLKSELMVDFMVGRSVMNSKVKYLGLRMPKPIMGLSAVQASPVVFLVEGQFDWLTLRQWGYPAITSGGTSLSHANIGAIQDKEVVIIPDYDPSGIGMKSAESLLAKLPRCGILDYSELRESNEKLDISKLAERPDAEKLFAEIVKEKLPWLGTLSNRTIQAFFPNLTNMTHFQSTWKPAV
jgi:DNA primase